ncbi:alginate lyase family protein [Paenibacillus sp. SYP-B3998]|uniref:Alginate lyase family protein n=1 Tax=Paenibacillus sp. SYP-B3998 TaxID=2678564 RepID=A0A6G3ZZA5_9BACL|nr:heparinase II/III family protein [Paenibacillus sp. SYP-B3998]NEW07430.1 alginate lyase family protein [Paenibacillus sp. SYP-B3998]
MSMTPRLGEKLKGLTWAANLVNELKNEIDRLLDAGSLLIPREPGGWWHQYVCPRHNTELMFDTLAVSASEFFCPYGCRIEGEAYKGAWLVFKHQSLARIALQAAAVYAVNGDEDYASLSKRLLVEYAEQFPLYPVHPEAQGWMLKGRAFHQALTEAIWSTTLIRAYLLLRDEGVTFNSEEQGAIDAFLELLAGSMEEYRRILIHERNNPENNYTAWLNASLSCVYAARGQRVALEVLVEGTGGFKHHLSIGVKPDQLEFEGSTYYHVFVLRAYLISAEMAKRFGIDLYACEGEAGQSMRGMLVALADLADDRGALPALHDGPLAREPYAREIAEIAEQGLAIYGIASLAPVAREAYRQLGAASGERCQLEAHLYGAGEAAVPGSELREAAVSAGPEPREARLFADSGFAVGRVAGNPLSFLADFGEHGGSHGHFDKLHLTLMHPVQTWTPDYGMVPYGSSLRKSWFAETASHNTVSVGGVSQAPHEGRCVRFEATATRVYAWLQSTEAYAGCVLDRHVLLSGEWLLDWFHVELTGEEPTQLAWWMHPAVPPLSEQLEALSVSDASAYSLRVQEQMLSVIGRFVPIGSSESEGAQVHASYVLRAGSDEATVFHTALILPGDELLAVHTPGDSIDPSVPLTALLHQRTDARADFIHVYRTGSRAEVKWLTTTEIEVSVSGVPDSATRIQLTRDQGLFFT